MIKRALFLGLTLISASTPFTSQAITEDTAKAYTFGAGILAGFLRYDGDKFSSHKGSEVMAIAGWTFAGLVVGGLIARHFTPQIRTQAAANIANEVGTELAVRHNIRTNDNDDMREYLQTLRTGQDVAFYELERLHEKVKSAENLLYKARRDSRTEREKSEVDAVASMLNTFGIQISDRTAFLRRQPSFMQVGAATWHLRK